MANDREPIQIDTSKFPSNSKTKAIKKTPEKVATAHRDTSAAKSFWRAFVAEDSKNIGGYILTDVVIPTLQDLILNAVTGSLESLFYGRSRRSTTSTTKKPYNSYYQGSATPQQPRNQTRENRSRMYFDDIFFENREDAEAVLERLLDYVREGQCATVADFYTLADITSDYTDEAYGWTNLSQARIRRQRRGWNIELPPVELLE